MNLQALAELEFTFFFPSDQAFIDLAQEVGLNTIQQLYSEDGLEIVKEILAYHFIESGKIVANEFENNQVLATNQGEALGVLLDNGVFILDKTGKSAKVIYGDNEILKGVIHVVDKVLLPQWVLNKI